MPDSHELSVAEVAALFNVNESTVRRWIRAGRLAARRTKPLRRDYRITRAEVERFIQETNEAAHTRQS